MSAKFILLEHEDTSFYANGFFCSSHFNLEKAVEAYYEVCENIVVAIEREKQIKGWLRKKKNDLVNAFNPEW